MKKLIVVLVFVLSIGCGTDGETAMAAGTGGSAGAAGEAGNTAGAAGAGGAAGEAGNTAGTAGAGGEAGSAGEGGAAGEAGSAGEGGTAGEAGSGGAAGEAGNAAGAAGAGGTTSTVPAECNERFEDAADTGACLADSDRIALCDIEDSIDQIMQDCGQGSCIGSILDTAPGGGFAACGATCVQENTDFSAECSGCFGEILACTMRECGTEALGSLMGNTDALDACIAEKCDGDFSACAGISLNDR